MSLSGVVWIDKSDKNYKYGRHVSESDLDSMDIFLTPFGELVRVVAVLVDGRPIIKRKLIGNGQDYCVKVPCG